MPKKTVRNMVANAKQLADEFNKAFLKGGRKKNFNKYVKGK
jgi:hypothetical protein